MQLEIAQRVGILPKQEYDVLQERVAEIGKMLSGLIASLEPPADETSDCGNEGRY